MGRKQLFLILKKQQGTTLFPLFSHVQKSTGNTGNTGNTGGLVAGKPETGNKVPL
jgi:hypothetical protein